MNEIKNEKFHQWNKKKANIIAKKESIHMTLDHWIIIYVIRDCYLKFNIQPSIRILIQILNKKFKNNKYSSRYLLQLFPKGPVKQAYKIAGLPKSNNCI